MKSRPKKPSQPAALAVGKRIAGKPGRPGPPLASTALRRAVARLTLAGYDQKEIARACGVSQSAVSRAIARLADDYREQAQADYATHRARELGRTECVLNQAQSSFAATGDPRFLELALRAERERVRVLGLDRPEQVSFDTQKAELFRAVLEVVRAFLPDAVALAAFALCLRARTRGVAPSALPHAPAEVIAAIPAALRDAP